MNELCVLLWINARNMGNNKKLRGGKEMLLISAFPDFAIGLGEGLV